MAPLEPPHPKPLNGSKRVGSKFGLLKQKQREVLSKKCNNVCRRTIVVITSLATLVTDLQSSVGPVAQSCSMCILPGQSMQTRKPLTVLLRLRQKQLKLSERSMTYRVSAAAHAS
eukprot:3602687-Amphidinium_carterae.1